MGNWTAKENKKQDISSRRPDKFRTVERGVEATPEVVFYQANHATTYRTNSASQRNQFQWYHQTPASAQTSRASVQPKLQQTTQTIYQGCTTSKAEEDEHHTHYAPAEQPCEVVWADEELLADLEQLDRRICRNIVQLFDEDNTIPFIARYRKDMTGGMDPDKLRKVKESYELVKRIRQKACTIRKTLSTSGKLDKDLASRISRARSMQELDVIGAQLKVGSRKTLAERARKLGLETPALTILAGQAEILPMTLVNPDVKGLESATSVKQGLQHIIADVLSKDENVILELEKIKNSNQVRLQSTLKVNEDLKEEAKKYALYHDFNQPIRTLKAHQVLAINRGEDRKVLSVKVDIPENLWDSVKNRCRSKWLKRGMNSQFRTLLFEDSMNDAIQRLLSPLVIRHIRAKLSEEAENESIAVFAKNLKQLLLTQPYRGKVVMAIDPGFRHGCKVAVVSPMGEVLKLDKFFLPQTNNKDAKSSADKLREFVRTFRCENIVLGNGTGCRETEKFLTDLIEGKWFSPLDVSYVIINEQGVSIYSCSTLAGEEFPGYDPNLISAISLARRLQDPLAELVKVEPKHLGVGMYQHDVHEKKLVSALDDVVSECVSFVGVDVNTASIYLLRRIAGLNNSRATNILAWRVEHKVFRNREQLKEVKGIGSKTYQQCAGFIRINPSTAGLNEEDLRFNPLDQTWIHPESYNLAYKVMNQSGVKVFDLGKPHFISAIKREVEEIGMDQLAFQYDTSELTMSLIVEALTRSPDHDLRSLSKAPLFRKGLISINDLIVGDVYSGEVRNVVHFGVFVDIGVGRDGLIYSRLLRGRELKINDRVNVKLVSVELDTGRIGLDLESVM